MIHAVVMAGGKGERFWPYSNSKHPKQLLPLVTRQSMLEDTLKNIRSFSKSAPVRLVVSKNLEKPVKAKVRGLRKVLTLAEPQGRNTAAAVALAARLIQREDPKGVMLVLTADHAIRPAKEFSRAMAAAAELAGSGDCLVTFGINPTRPDVGYGYVESSAEGKRIGGLRTMEVAGFHEKPSEEKAKQYVKSGKFFWNSGMFVLGASTWLKSLAQFRPDILAPTQASWEASTTDASFVRPGKDAFMQVPSESVDYAVMEKCPGVVDIRMVALNAGWNDLGAWDAVWQVGDKDPQGNACNGDVLMHDTRNTLVHATSRLVGAVGLNDVVVVETPDAVLVTDRARSQDVKHIVTQLSACGRGEHTLHRKVHRPWGWYDSIDHGGRFQVKRIMVRPGASLSLQMHHHRAEHWIVVKGTAEITNGDKILLLTENQSTYIPLGEVHRLANPGAIPLEIIEVQSGSYLGEDDIVRFEDSYGRDKI